MRMSYKHPVCFEGSFLALLCDYECRYYCLMLPWWPLRQFTDFVSGVSVGLARVKRLFYFMVILRTLKSFLCSWKSAK